MKYMILIGLFFCNMAYTQSPRDTDWQKNTENADYLHRAIKQVTDVMVYDVYSPPVTSRTYAYIAVAAYETLIQNQDNFLSLAGQLNGLMPTPQAHSQSVGDLSLTLAAVHAILETAKNFVISEEWLAKFEEELLREFEQHGMPKISIANSLAYGKQVSEHILAWAKKDNYLQLRSMPDYSVRNDKGSWKPTPPAYLKAIEPNWNQLRPFLMDSANQFKAKTPPPFSEDPNSSFYQEALIVYGQVNSNTPEQIDIANFWDCNPFKMNIRGHVMYATKKISPNGHWMNIAALSSKKTKASPVLSAEAYARLAVTLADVIISCWNEKYLTSVIRPETYINLYIDPQWMPVLQTPPFPEYTSGHSVISTSAAVVLTQLFGENFEFADSTEEEFGLPTRNFTSFHHAAQEAAISRLYGGIHYRPAIENGQDQGRRAAHYFEERLKSRKQ